MLPISHWCIIGTTYKSDIDVVVVSDKRVADKSEKNADKKDRCCC